MTKLFATLATLGFAFASVGCDGTNPTPHDNDDVAPAPDDNAIDAGPTGPVIPTDNP